MSNNNSEIKKVIWKKAKKLGGKKLNNWEFRPYVLGILFYRYISESFTNSINANEKEAGNDNFNYANCSDEEVEAWAQDRINAKGFFIKPSELFENVFKQAKDNVKDLNETLNNIFKNIIASAKGTDNETNFSELFEDLDLNNNRLGQEIGDKNKKIKDLLTFINEIESNHKDNESGSFCDIYEFLLQMYAEDYAEKGSKAYTPPWISELLAHLAIDGRDKINKVYDPACGSGSLLLKFKKILGKDKVNKYCGQEINLTTCNLCRMNMFLHNINYDEFNIRYGDTLLDADQVHFSEANNGEFEAIVSNPPYSEPWANNNQTLLNDERFSPAGVLAPESRSDMAFVMHCRHHLANNGVAAIACFPGIMYRKGKEQKIRKYLIDNNYIDCIINLASNLFYKTSTSACVMILRKNKKDSNILFINASEEFVKSKTKNILTEQNIQNILKAYKERTDKQNYCRLVTYEEISEKKWDLQVSTYVEQENKEEKIDIEELEAKIDATVKKTNNLREEINLIIKEIKNNMDKQ